MIPSVSVIIPVYNTEYYLKQCLDSIVNQTEKNIEIIVVNDASPDNSEAIILKYAKEYDNIVYVKNEKNLGAFVTRDIGVQTSKGKYLLFVDSDDYVVAQMIEKMLVKAEKYNLDCVICNFCLYINNKIVSINTLEPINSEEILDGYDVLKKHILINDIGSQGAKLYRREVFCESQKPLNELKICNLNFNEDFLCNIYFFFNAKTVASINEELYIYRYNSSSGSKSPKYKYLQDALFCVELIKKLLKDNDELSDFFEYSAYKLKRIISLYGAYCRNSSFKKNTGIYSEIVNIINKYSLWFVIKNPYIKIKVKLKFILFKFNLFRLFVETFAKKPDSFCLYTSKRMF